MVVYMDRNKSSLPKKLEYYKTACHEAGLKVTHQRLEIFSELALAEDHPTAETLYKRLRKSMPTISLDTVYRALTTFEEHNLISRVQTTESYARFEAEMEQHHHAICSQCNRITDFQWDICDTSELPKQIANWGQIRNKQITLTGISGECVKVQKMSS